MALSNKMLLKVADIVDRGMVDSSLQAVEYFTDDEIKVWNDGQP